MTPRLSIVMPYHNNPDMLQHHYRHWVGLPENIKRFFEVVICDDASDEPATYPTADIRASVSIFRIPPPHIPWSHRCATNIAAFESKGNALLVTDIDHVVPFETFRYLMNFAPQHDVAYRFTRRNADGSEYKPHPDSWFLSRDLWQKTGGYDLRYRGHYGQNSPFIERVERASACIRMLDTPLVRYSRDDIPDASERVLPRKSPETRSIIAELRAKFKRDGSYYAYTPPPLYTKVEP